MVSWKCVVLEEMSQPSRVWSDRDKLKRVVTHPLTKNKPTLLLAMCSLQFKEVSTQWGSTWINRRNGFEWDTERGLAERVGQVKGRQAGLWPALVFQLRKTVITTQSILRLYCTCHLLGKLCCVYGPVWIQFFLVSLSFFWETSPLPEGSSLNRMVQLYKLTMVSFLGEGCEEGLDLATQLAELLAHGGVSWGKEHLCIIGLHFSSLHKSP